MKVGSVSGISENDKLF